jgi:hypothetical protein
MISDDVQRIVGRYPIDDHVFQIHALLAGHRVEGPLYGPSAVEADRDDGKLSHACESIPPAPSAVQTRKDTALAGSNAFHVPGARRVRWFGYLHTGQ